MTAIQKFLFRAVIALSVACGASIAAAQAPEAYPNRPLRFIVGFGPGGSTDLLSRTLANFLAEKLGQPVVPDLKTGAAGAIAADIVAKAPADGHTLILLTGAHPVTGSMRKSLPHDALRDFSFVSTVVSYPVALVVSTASPYRTLDELLAKARTRAGQVSFASVGVGSGQHLIGEWIGSEAGAEFLHVPFKSQPMALTEMLAGRVDMMIDTLTSAYPQVKAGKTRALAVTTRERSPFLPDVPSITATVPNVEFASWAGLATTAGTPPAAVARLNALVREFLKSPDVLKLLETLAGQPSPSTPDEMRQLVQREMARWAKVIESRGIERQ
jgi:tripartite-type tricarboxylate transporter receptor subunit TctC